MADEAARSLQYEYKMVAIIILILNFFSFFKTYYYFLEFKFSYKSKQGFNRTSIKR